MSTAFYIHFKPENILKENGYVQLRNREWHRPLSKTTRYHVFVYECDFLKGHRLDIHFDNAFHKTSRGGVAKEIKKLKAKNVNVNDIIKKHRKEVSMLGQKTPPKVIPSY